MSYPSGATNVSANIICVLKASVTFPTPIPITMLADDTDPITSDDITIGATSRNINGHLVSWQQAQSIPFKLAVIPESLDDQNLAALFIANMPGQKIVANDEVTLTLTYPAQNKIVTFTAGRIISGSPISSSASAGRLKTKTYGFEFGNVSIARF